MKSRALLLIVLGLLVGPGYYIFCERLSGRAGQTYALTDKGERWSLPDGSILRLRGGKAYKPLPLEMTPDANGYRLRFDFNVTGAAESGSNNYQVGLLQGDVDILHRSLKVQGSGHVGMTLDTLQIAYPGSYLLVLEEVGKPALEVSGVGLQVDTGVEQPRMWLAWSGFALLALGTGLLLRDALLQARRRK